MKVDKWFLFLLLAAGLCFGFLWGYRFGFLDSTDAVKLCVESLNSCRASCGGLSYV